MALTYTEFDTTQQNLINDLMTAIDASSDWAKITPTTVQLTTSVAASAGGTVLTFTSTAGPGWAIGNVIRIGAAGAADTEYRTITAISGTTITVAALSYAHGIGTNVYWGNETMKCTTTRGADMIVDLNDAHSTPTGTFMTLAAYTSHTGTVGTNKLQRFLYWRAVTAGALTSVVHVVVSAGKEHLYISVEGPRTTETNPDVAAYGSQRNYFFICDMVPYHASDTNPCVFVGGRPQSTSSSSLQNLNHVGHLSKNHAGTVGWNGCRLLTLAFPSAAGATAGVNPTRQTTADGNFYLAPYVCFSDTDGLRGRLSSFFNAGWAAVDELAPVMVPPVGAKITYGGATYKLLQANRGGGSNATWDQLGASSNTSSLLAECPVVAVPST